MRQCRGDFPQRTRTLARNLDDRRTLLKIVDAERRRKARGTRSRQHMIWPGAVIAQRLARIDAQEDRTGVTDQRQQRVGISDGEFKMLGRDLIGDLAGMCEIACFDQRAACCE